MAGDSNFRFEIEKSADQSRDTRVTTVRCHGKLVSENAGQLKSAVKELLSEGGRTVIDLSDVHFVDSSGLGAMVALKVSAVNQGLCILEFVNMTPRVLELMRLTGLAKLMTASA
jgi:anti-anti-sigma factor